MGRAIVREPQAFLMDEPLSNLDAKLRVQMRAEISKIQHSLNVTTVYVTHDQIEAMTMGDRVAVFARRLQQVDTPQNLYDHPDNVFVAAFIGSPQMNLLEATVRAAIAARSCISGAASSPCRRRCWRPGRHSPATTAGVRSSGSVPSTSRPPTGMPPTPSGESSTSGRGSVPRSSCT